MSLAPYVRILGRGPGRSRALTQDEAQEAMTLILDGAAEPEAVGALLMLLRFRGESAEEVAGLTAAARGRVSAWRGVGAEVDWPTYAAGRTRGHPYFLLAAKLLAGAGHPVLLHGWNSHQKVSASIRGALAGINIPVCATPDAAHEAMATGGIGYAPLENLDGRLLDLLCLRDTLGLRSIVNTVLRLLNPAGAPVALQGVFHPSYRTLQSDTGTLLGQPIQCVIKGGGGEFERHPGKAITAFVLRGSDATEETIPAFIDETRRLHEDAMPTIADLWTGARHDPFADAIVTGTAALALAAIDPALTHATAMQRAMQLWTDRHSLSDAA